MFKNAKAKHGLNKTWDLRQNWSQIGGDQTVERERGERKREKKRKRKRRRREEKRKGRPKSMELTLGMNSSMDHMDFVWNSRKVMSSKPRVC